MPDELALVYEPRSGLLRVPTENEAREYEEDAEMQARADAAKTDAEKLARAEARIVTAEDRVIAVLRTASPGTVSSRERLCELAGGSKRDTSPAVTRLMAARRINKIGNNAKGWFELAKADPVPPVPDRYQPGTNGVPGTGTETEVDTRYQASLSLERLVPGTGSVADSRRAEETTGTKPGSSDPPKPPNGTHPSPFGPEARGQTPRRRMNGWRYCPGAWASPPASVPEAMRQDGQASAGLNVAAEANRAPAHDLTVETATMLIRGANRTPASDLTIDEAFAVSRQLWGHATAHEDADE